MPGLGTKAVKMIILMLVWANLVSFFLLFTDSSAVTGTGVIPHDVYFSDICQVVVTF